MNRIPIREVVVVEGKYDKIRLSSLLDATIITTEGFGIFRNKEKQAMLRRMAKERGLLLMTDSDSAGFVIRNFLRGCVPSDCLRHVYIPQLAGKEARKTERSKEGLLGVEGMDTDTLVEALRRAGVSTDGQKGTKKEPACLDKQRLFDDGLVGGVNSAELRSRLAGELGLPTTLTANALIEAINILCDESEYAAALARVMTAGSVTTEQ
ncbi:MAG: DUF4093 domain-containing protein [Ruminococcaceae bacterium]|nr:DUF4093 domain-containing protein [Oscillospiraceae bacterium]